MDKDLIFYTNPKSRGRVVQWVLEEIGCQYKTKLLGFGSDMKSSDFLSLNPMGKVPVIVHGNTVVTECAAICSYLADAFPQSQLAPSFDDPLRGDYYRWMFFTAGPYEAAITNKELGVLVDKDSKGFVGYGCFDDVINTLGSLLQGRDYVLGDQFSVVDIYLGSYLVWDMHSDMVEKKTVFLEYQDRIFSRPAAVRARGITKQLMSELERIEL